MPKDFDAARRQRQEQSDLDFVIGGEQFRLRPGVRPEVLAPYDGITGDTSIGDTMRIIDEVILAMVDPEGHDRYRALREREDDPLTVEDLQELTAWLMEAQTNRPTKRPGDSFSGPGITGMSSTGVSSSPVTSAA